MLVVDVERLDGKWLIAATSGASGACPSCSVPSTTRHGRYSRQLQDLPEQGTVVALSVQVTRWQCRNPHCERATFSQLPPCIAAPHARRTTRVVGLVQLLGHAAGGRPAERLMTQLGMPTSDDTILRHLKRQAAKSRTEPLLRVAGVDDWGWIKGRHYGTLILDLERREVVDVLPDRSAESIAQWLRRHPEVEIISRDRCDLYAQGARQGAPQARQVVDRFHVLQNLRERIEQQLSRGQPVNNPTSEEVDSELRPATSAIGCSPPGEPEVMVHRHLVKQGMCDKQCSIASKRSPTRATR
jgi:transposase